MLDIYYTGHGYTNNGNWVVNYKSKNPEASWTITLAEVLEQLEKAEYENHLYLMCDCCYSGSWCEDLY